jgi:hypothetical protein
MKARKVKDRKKQLNGLHQYRAIPHHALLKKVAMRF